MQLDKELVFPALASVVALIGAAFDLKTRRIPNVITGPSLFAGLLLHLSLDGWHGLFVSFAGALVCGIVFLIFYLAGGMGAGDVKLIAAVAGVAGLSHSASLLVLTSLAGGVMGIALALARGQLRSTLFNVGTLATHHTHQGLTPHPEINVRNASTLRLPYGLAIAAGSCITLYLQGMQR